MKEIGGYFGLEINPTYDFPHSEGLLLNSGRTALQCLIESKNDVKCVHLPYYTCHSVADVLDRVGVEKRFYSINDKLEIEEDLIGSDSLHDGEYLIVNNYFGLKDQYIASLSKRFAGHLIVDNSQALFAESLKNVPTYYSPRKFLGIPDGGILCYSQASPVVEKLEKDTSYDRCSHLLMRYDLGASGGYNAFHENGKKLSESGCKRMSSLTEALLRSVDYKWVKERRSHNFEYLHKKLKSTNLLNLNEVGMGLCPLVYPYLTTDKKMKKRMIENKIFCATYWPNVFEWCKEESMEWTLADCLTSLPIDQRYDESDMQYILSVINK